MNVGFYLIDTRTLDSMCGYACARAMTRSVRKAMPGVPVVHFTDEESPAVDGVDDVRRLPPEPMARLRMRHHAQVEGDWLFVDTDVLIQQDVRPVFDDPFDIAVTTRDWGHVQLAERFADRMPYNMGVVFSRSSTFWRAVLERVARMEKSYQRWMGDQEAFNHLIRLKLCNVAKLSGTIYNFPPDLDPSPESLKQEREAAILHFKGPQRKPLMLRRIGERVPPCV